MAIQANNRFNDNSFTQFTAFSIMARCPLHITLVYRPPNSGRQNLQQLCNLLERQEQNSIVIGDFNLPDISWEDESSGPKGRQLYETVLENNLVQLVNFATHSKGNILDLAITNCPERILSVRDFGKLGNSDHCIIELLASISLKKQQQVRQIVCWDKADIYSMKRDLSQVDWEDKLDSKNVEQGWTLFKQILTNCTDKYVPKITVKMSARQRWVTKEIIRLIRTKKRRWREYKQINSNETKTAYEVVEAELKKKIKKAKRKREREN
jgi:hypothetical protein